MNNKNIIAKGIFAIATTFNKLFSNINEISAHGYVQTPKCRAYLGQLYFNQYGWDKAKSKYGNVITNPQGLEYNKGFPQSGPVDGKIASAMGAPGDYVMDEQTSNRWDKVDINTGINTFTWYYTANHATSKWHYYITKQGWDQNKPLSRSFFEHIGTVNHDGSSSSNSNNHKITIPSDRKGYHVILAIWDVADTANAFHSVIDVNVNNGGIEEDNTAPSIPSNLQASVVTDNRVELKWNASTDNVGVKEYEVYRDEKLIAVSNLTSYIDRNLAPGTTYNYKVRAVDFSGNRSEFSTILSVKTKNQAPIIKPQAPNNLHTMSVSENSVDLMWIDPNDKSEVSYYNIYRDGVIVGTSKSSRYIDNNLKPNTKYSYFVKVMALNGLLSDSSNVINVITKDQTIDPDPTPNPEEINNFRFNIQPSFNLNKSVDSRDFSGTLTIWSNNNSQKQIFKFKYENSKKAYQIFENDDDGRVVTMNDEGEVFIVSNIKLDIQYWILEKSSDGFIIIKSKSNPNLVLDVSGGADIDGSNVVVYNYHGGTNQKWKLSKIN